MHAFLLHQRLVLGSKKTLLDQKRLLYPKITSLAAAGRAQRYVPFDRHASLSHRRSYRPSIAAMSMLRIG
jgi:hypothetical protein